MHLLSPTFPRRNGTGEKVTLRGSLFRYLAWANSLPSLDNQAAFANLTQLRPLSLARYSALSASRIRSLN